MARREPYEKGRTSPHEGRRIGDDALMRTCRWLVFSLLALAAVPAGGRVVERVSVDSTGHQGNGDSSSPAISADGSSVAFTSAASNLVLGDSNGFEDVFVHDTVTGVTERVSVDSTGHQGNGDSLSPAISADGSSVAFTSAASNLVSGDTNGFEDVFVHARVTGVTERVSVDSTGHQGNGDSLSPAISADGSSVAFTSAASNLVSGDTNGFEDVFVHARVTGVTERVSVDSTGHQGNGDSLSPAISADGSYVAFTSAASNLVLGDSNGFEDVFVHARVTGVTERVSVDSTGHQGNGDSLSPAISADGSYVAFTSAASNLVSGDTNGFEDVFVSTANTPTPTPTPTGTPRPTATPGSCIGDCTGKGQVTVDDILTMINIALGNTPVGNCLAGDANSDGQITVDEILTAVNNALNGCGG
jgi:Tol biopolymer transport system component